jgi:hypothetical protein
MSISTIAVSGADNREIRRFASLRWAAKLHVTAADMIRTLQ